VKPVAGVAGLIEMNYSVAENKPELPQWRIELSKRLQEIKLKRDTGPEPAVEGPAPPTLPFTAPTEPAISTLPRAPIAPPPAPEPPVKPVRRPPKASRPAARSSPVVASTNEPKPGEPGTALPLFDAAAKPKAAEIRDGKPTGHPHAAPDAIQELIDRTVARQAPDRTSAPAGPPVARPHRPEPQGESKLILLSRTLSGLVDLILIVLCAGSFVIAADYFSGIDVLDQTSLISYGALLGTTYFVYSIFFLLSANQTIGMMITDLRVVDSSRGRPGSERLLGRCLLYPVSLLPLGLGLLWGCFDRQSRCLHDTLSGTRVVRLGA
jgi:uncharacterized RDD family membrane protein YckC